MPTQRDFTDLELDAILDGEPLEEHELPPVEQLGGHSQPAFELHDN